MSTTLDVPTRASLLLAASDPANEKARAAFAECYAGLIRDWCRRWELREADQEDVVQRIWVRLFEKLPKYDPSQRFRGWLHTMIKHAIADHHRERQRHPAGYGSGDTGVLSQLHEVPAPDDPAVEDLSQGLAGQVERDQRLHEACECVRRRVKPHNWQAFWLTTYEGEPVAVVAERLGMTPGAILVAKHRVIKMIRKEFEGTARCEERGTRPSGSS
jgi:RNA polymerase sigma-70 factor (ECF subfamily)